MPKDSEQEAEHTTNFISLDLETKASEREAGKDIHLVVGSHNAISTMEVGKKVIRTFQVALVVKNSPINAGDKRNTGLIPGSRRSLKEDLPGVATHSSILAWRIPWTKDPGRLWSIVSQRVVHN